MILKWNGHSSFTIKSTGGVVVITDPYEPGAYGGAVGYGGINDKADMVTVSHDHPDHSHVAGLPGNPHVVRKSEKVKGIEFTMIDAFHDKTKGSERGKVAIFVFTVDGVRICHLGDLGHTLDKETIAKIGKVDVLLIPIGGVFTIDPNEAARVMQSLDPAITIPMHYKTDKCGFGIAKLDDFLSGKESFTVNVGKTEMELTTANLPKKQEIRVLKHAC